MSPSSPRVILGQRACFGSGCRVGEGSKEVFSGSGAVRVCGVSAPFASAMLPSPYALFVEAGLL